MASRKVSSKSRSRWGRRPGAILLGAVALYIVGLIPSAAPPVITEGEGVSFRWDDEGYWRHLAALYEEAQRHDCAVVVRGCSERMDHWQGLLAAIDRLGLDPSDSRFEELERLMFESAARVAACPGGLSRLADLVEETRRVVKRQSVAWDADARESKERLYRVIYGGRMALEEVVLQHADAGLTLPVRDAGTPSATPSADLFGARVHSGDLLVSRGGAPTSALIARGNDYPGNFSHVALVHVDERTGRVSIIEAHIERGVAVATVARYLADVKLRVMLLRPRADLPSLVRDPLLPHKAASAALARATSEHIPYDFAMDFEDHSRLFCSEVASAPYEDHGVRLWTNLSNISDPTVRAWLRGFGVQHFRTEAPSDLEYDPQLEVVAEWRDPGVLRKDHLDNAVLDAMIAAAPPGSALAYDRWLLPFARLAKGYSVVLNRLGRVGPVPEGMDAAAAVRNKSFTDRHERIVEITDRLAREFEQRHGHVPPYWELVRLAERALAGP